MGVDQALLYPTWFAEGFFLVRDPDVAYALARAYNDWIADFCKAGPERLFAAAILPLQNMDFALEELQRVARNPSVRAVFIRPMFVEDHYLNHPYYDPLWAELERLGITVAVHATPGLWNPEWTSLRSVPRESQRPFGAAAGSRRRRRSRVRSRGGVARSLQWHSSGCPPGRGATRSGVCSSSPGRRLCRRAR